MLALDAARQGMVLLDNKGALPLSRNNTKNLAIIGPNDNVTITIINNYVGILCKYTTLQGLQKYTKFDIIYEVGYQFVNCTDKSLIKAVTMVAPIVDVVVLVVGKDQSIESENYGKEFLIWLGF